MQKARKNAGLGKQEPKGSKMKSQKQVGLLLGKNSPLSMSERFRLKKELDSGQVKIKG